MFETDSFPQASCSIPGLGKLRAERVGEIYKFTLEGDDRFIWDLSAERKPQDIYALATRICGDLRLKINIYQDSILKTLVKLVSKLERTSDAEEDLLKPEIQREPAGEIADTFSYTGDRVFHGRIQVSALTTPLARFTKLNFSCCESEKCKIMGCPFKDGLILSLDDSRIFDPSAFATYFDTNRILDAVYVYVEKAKFPLCPEWRSRIVGDGGDERAVTHAIVLDLAGKPRQG